MLPEEPIETIKRAVARGEPRSVSAHIATRLESGAIMDTLFADWDAARGAPSAQDTAWAEQELDRVFGTPPVENSDSS
ncbi:MAG: hypothetical protein GEV00_05350 [Actinophytocola sp.]|nr:hypothetical protein [Actinophytocola sp.]